MKKGCFAISLLISLSFFLLTACGGSKNSTGNNTLLPDFLKSGNAGDTSEDNGAPGDNGPFWIEVISQNKANIYLKDPAVNEMRKKDLDDGSAQVLNGISIRLSKNGEEMVFLDMSSGLKSIYIESLDFYGSEVISEGYENDTAVWSVHCDGIANLLRECDYGFGGYDDFEDYTKNRTLFEYTTATEMAAIFIKSGSEQGVRLGFRDNYMSVELFGKDMLDNAKKQGGLSFDFTNGEPQYSDVVYWFSFTVSDNVQTISTSIDGYEYECDGLVNDSGTGWTSCPPQIWAEQDDGHISMWFYAPGFREAVSGMNYCVGIYDDQGEFVGEEGSVSDIIGEYRDYSTPTPKLPSEFISNESEDAQYFAPITPYYAVFRYDYPEVAIADHPEWRLAAPHNTWWYAPFAWHYVPVTKMVLASYNACGQVVALRSKYIYDNEQEAVLSRLTRNHPLKTNIGGPYGTEAEWEEWVWENFEAEPGSGSDGAIYRLLHDDNKLYYTRDSVDMSYTGGHMVKEDDHESEVWRMLDYYEVFCGAEEIRKGAFSYEAPEFGGGTHSINECSYTTYASFDMQVARDATEGAYNALPVHDDGEIETEDEWFAVPVVNDEILKIFSRDEFEPYLTVINNYNDDYTKLYLRLTTLGTKDAAEIFRRLDAAGFDSSMYADKIDESTCFYGGEKRIEINGESQRFSVNTSVEDGDVIVYFCM